MKRDAYAAALISTTTTLAQRILFFNASSPTNPGASCGSFFQKIFAEKP